MKKNYKKIIILVLLLINCIGLYKICNAKSTNGLTSNNIKNKDRLEKIRDKKVLTVVTSDFPPFSFIDPNTNTYTGIDIDILNEIAKQLGADKVELKVVPYSDLLTTLNTDDSIDVAASGIIITDKRKELVNFTKPLYKLSESIVLPTVSKINFKEDLKDAVIGIINGSAYMDLVENWKKEGKIKDIVIFQTLPELLSAVKLQKVDASILSSIISEYILFTQDPYLRIMYPYNPTTTSTVGIAIRKDDVTLLNEINKTIDNMKKFETIKQILKKYGLNDTHIIYSF